MKNMKNIFNGNYSEVINLKNLLENSNIEAFIQNENMGAIQPWTITSGGLNPIILKVEDQNFEEALKIIEDYKNGEFEIEVKETKEK
jgi:hypothetical protein